MAKKKELTLVEVEELLKKEKGDSYIIFGNEKTTAPRIPTGIMSVDKALGGGVPRGRITEIFGSESNGKSLLLLSIIAQAQKEGGVCVYLDLEKTFDPEWAKLNGVDLDTLRIIEPANGDEAWEVCKDYLQTGEVDVFGIDSVAQMVPSAELEGSIGQANIGLAARLNSQAMRSITSMLGTNNPRTALILVNQVRANVSVGPAYGKPTVTSGGKAIPFYASLRLQMARIGRVKNGDDLTGAEFRVKVEKAKLTGVRPWATATFDVDFDTGIDNAKDLLKHAMARGIVKKRGAWYYVDEDEKIQGERAFKEHMIESGLLDKWKEEFKDEQNED